MELGPRTGSGHKPVQGVKRESSDAYSVGGQAVVLERADEVVLLDAGRLVLVQMLEYL